VGIPCILVYLLYVNEVSYLVGKPFYSTFLFIWEAVLVCVGDQWRCSSVQCCGEFYTLFLCCKICKVSSDVWLHSADIRKQAQRRKACSAGAGSPAGLAPQQQQLTPSPSMSIEQMFMMQTQAVQAIS
jgi:hypothetical protein